MVPAIDPVNQIEVFKLTIQTSKLMFNGSYIEIDLPTEIVITNSFNPTSQA